MPSLDTAKTLQDTLDVAGQNMPDNLATEIIPYLDTLVAHSDTNKGVLAVFITLMLKKQISPQQDIRLHQAGMEGGFSARGFDERYVTPFLRENNFPFMAAGAGALTRSLEQAMPYNLQYPGRINPVPVREAFLHVIDQVQHNHCKAKDILHYLFYKLILRRDEDKNLKLIKPKGKPIAVLVEKVGRHFNESGRGASHLPVLALYAIYTRMISEVQKYKGLSLCDLQSHNAADMKTGFLGDIQVNDQNNNPIEVVEVKHDIKLTAKIMEDCYNKFKTSKGVRTYYLLSTNETLDDVIEISNYAKKIHKDHGCQMIVNGIQSTLRYYLRLISNPDNFLDSYVELVEQQCSYEIKMAWNSLWE